MPPLVTVMVVEVVDVSFMVVVEDVLYSPLVVDVVVVLMVA